MTKAEAWVSYGLGGQAFDPAGGEVALVAKIAALGVNCGDSPYLYSDVQTIVNGILAAPAGTKIILGGDSLGANNAPYIATALLGKRKIDYMFGFQPSVWGYHGTVTENVVEYLCIYNPNWLETFGLGDYPWPVADGNKITKGRYIMNSDPHPGDSDVAMQATIIKDIKRVIGA